VVAAPPELAAAVDALRTRATELHGLTLDAPALLDALRRRLGDDATATTVGALHADVVLAIVAAAGDPRAIAACDAIASRELDFAAARLRATGTQADDLRSELRRLLFVAEDERPAALATFTGRGDLRGYARVIVTRALVRRIQRDRREVTLDDQVLDAFTPAAGPEVALLREHYRPMVDAALRAGLAGLSERHRALLRYHLLDGWSIDRIGERYGVHRATAARWLTAARDELGAAIRADLSARLEIGESQVDSIVGLVVSRVDVSLERILAE